ncbi:ribosomal protein S18 acetylase RimI-like enzyme [Metabacillus crassostreae]|uniref:GNAT family N-acetyltransferase n=1 Tax=Metabacillus crassostreae TaxID=929098 RepID=UPI00195DBFF7|nr:GNAT family N-acetyltransferase [Metabacillus crassostreae]MBM7602249.1 ribosomal protein S18 acetylase RimI-like enzyme [Metabacillus crassostreae]
MFKKELYVFGQNNPVKATIRNYNKEDFDQLIHIQQKCFPPPFPAELLWNKEQLNNHITLFPEGALCVEIKGQLVGSMTSLMIKYNEQHKQHKWEDITDNGYIRNHNPLGNSLYIVDISVNPEFRQLGLGKWLMFSMYNIVVEKKLERLLGGGRMPGYKAKADEMTAEEYIQHVVKGKIKDPVITFLLRCGRVPLHVIPNYLEDEDSLNYGTLMEWKNPFINS